MFNPYAEKIYDYFGGIEDIKKAKVSCTYLLYMFIGSISNHPISVFMNQLIL